MKSKSAGAYLVAIIFGLILVTVGTWNGYLKHYLMANAESTRAEQLFNSPTGQLEYLLIPEVNLNGNTTLTPGQDFAVIRIPSLGTDWIRTISEGTTPQILDRLGTGHYIGTEFPGEPGNFAIAGHSGNKWTPFARYQEIDIGDLIEIETFSFKFTYQVAETVIVDETNMATVYENPSLKDSTADESWLTITTCLIEGQKEKRIAIFAKLVSEDSKE